MATWKGVITDAGATLLAAWPGGGTLNIDGAAAGTGTVAEAALPSQSALVSERQEMSIVSVSTEEGGRRLKLQLTAPTEGYTLNQIGIWASLDGGITTLLGIYQTMDGVVIPSATESPEFTYTFYALLLISTSGTLTLTVEPTNLVTQSTMEQWHEAHSAQRGAGTLLASGWSSTAQYSFEATYPHASYDVDVEPSNLCTAAQYKAFAKAQAVGCASANVLTAIGTVPTVDIPIVLTVRRK